MEYIINCYKYIIVESESVLQIKYININILNGGKIKKIYSVTEARLSINHSIV